MPDGVHLRADNSLRSKIRPGHGGSGLTANAVGGNRQHLSVNWKSSGWMRRGLARIPLLVRRGGCGIKKISAKPTLPPQTGWSLTRNVTCERPLFLDGRPYRACAGSARRPLRIRWLRGIFLMSRPPLLTRPHEEGICNTLLVQHLMHEGDRNRSLADGRCDAFDIAASDVADSEHSGQARFEQMRIPEQRPMRSHQVFF